MKFLPLLLVLLSSNSFADLCGMRDDRVAYADPRVARFTEPDQFTGCTVTLISKNCVVTTGTCANRKENAEFNVPSSIAGIPQRSSEEDTYTIDYGFLKGSRGGIGEEWAVTKLSPNPITGKSAGEVQGFFKVSTSRPKKSDKIIVVQYSHAPNTENHYAQQLAQGQIVKVRLLLPSIIEHNADTSYGAAGAPIINAQTGELIGINTHSGCARSANAGTSIWGTPKFKEAIEACLRSDQ